MKDKNKDKLSENEARNTTKYGEFVCSNYQWLPLEVQKDKANKMNEMTKKDNKE